MTNTYKADCFLCALPVIPGTGELDGRDSLTNKWRVRHGLCPVLTEAEMNVAKSVEKIARDTKTKLKPAATNFTGKKLTYADN